MTQADRIRAFVLGRYVNPARAAGWPKLVIRAGDIHHQMGLTSALPAVCSVLGNHKFQEIAGVTLWRRTGPAEGSNVYFEFDLLEKSSANIALASNGRAEKHISRLTDLQHHEFLTR